MRNSRYKRIYEIPKTPYQRVMESEHVAQEKKDCLKTIHDSLDPIELKNAVQLKLKEVYRIFKLLKRSQSSSFAA